MQRYLSESMHWCTCSCLQCSVLFLLHIHFTCFNLCIWFSMCVCVLSFLTIFKHWFKAMIQMMCYSLCCFWIFLVSLDLGVSVGLTVSKWYRWILCLTTVSNLHKSWIKVQWNIIHWNFVFRKHFSWRGQMGPFPLNHLEDKHLSVIVPMDPEFPPDFCGTKISTNYANISRVFQAGKVTKRPLLILLSNMVNHH